MNDGLSIDIVELIACKNYVRHSRYHGTHKMQASGIRLSKFRGRGMDFSEARNYQAGDEIRHMEWRVTARTGRPHIKIYHEEKQRPVIIMNDFNPSMYFGTSIALKSVVAAKLAAMIAWTAISQGDRVGGLLFGALGHDEFVPKQRETGILPWLAKLSSYTTQYKSMPLQQSRPLSEALLRLRHVVRPGCLIILISDMYQLDNESAMHLNRLHLHNDILLYHICDEIEITTPKSGIYTIGCNQEATVLDLNNTAIRKKYQQFCDSRQRNIRDLCQRTQIQYNLITSNSDIPQIIQQTLPRRPGG